MTDRQRVLFNPNASYGCGAYGAPEYRTARDVIAQMDYLGVQRALVWHVQARDVNPTWGNRRLLAELGADAAVAERLIPALVVTPGVCFEDGGLECVREALGSGRARALRIFPGTSRFALGQIERLVSEVAAHRPVIFWDFRDTTGPQDVQDMIALAGRFPQVSVVCTQLMWPQFGAALDMMWRCRNVLIDTSWLHMQRAIELLVGRFGVERVLFGLGPRAHYGAAIGALMHADISESDRERIAHLNAERLLGLKAADVVLPEPPLRSAKPLWERHRSGRPLDGVRVIDAHGHTPPHTRGWYLPHTEVEEGLVAVVKRMDQLGIERSILSPEEALFGHPLQGNADVEGMLAKHAGRLSGYLVYNPLYGDELAPHLDAFLDRGTYVGFKVLPDYWRIPVTDPRYGPVWACAQRRRLPVLFHTWQGAYSAPSALTEIVARHPDAVFILGHSGGGDEGRRQAEALTLAARNVYLEFCGSFTASIPWQDTLARVGADRVAFGSDAVAHDQAWELARYLSTPVPDGALTPGLGANMVRILEAARRR